jgi:hypothetical protein
MEFFQHSERDGIYDLITDYYDNPILYKVKNINNLSMYAIQLPCFLLNEKRYLIALINQDDNSLNYGRYLKDLRWKTLMIRSLEDENLQSLSIHNYSIKRDDKYKIPLKIKSRNNNISIYECNLGLIEVSLLHTRNHEFEYPNEGNLVSAFETFKTLLYWK